MKPNNLFKLLPMLVAVCTISSCLDPIEPEHELEPLPSETAFDLEVYPITEGTNAIVLKNNTTQYAPYWDYGIGVSTRQLDTVIIPYTGELTVKFTGICDGGTVTTERKVNITQIDWPKLPSDEEPTLLYYDFSNGTFAPQIENEAALTATSIENINVGFEAFEEQEGFDGNNLREGIRDHGQGPIHINALNEQEALNPASPNNKNDYLSFTVTPTTGSKLDLKWLSFKIQARTGEKTGNPVELSYYAALYSSVDGFTSGNRLGEVAEVSANKASTTSGWITHEVNIDSLVTGINEPVEFRIYFWRIGNTDPRDERWVELDDVKLHGTVENE